MSWYPIAFLPPQIENASGVPYSGGVLKAYAAGTSTNIPMATDYTGVTTAASMLLNASGYPTYLGTIVIPHLQQNYKLALYPTQAAADANSGAVWTVDNVQIAPSTNTSFIQYFDGDGVNATFTLSQNFGTDENILMVFADRAAASYITNGDFASDTIWTKGGGWTIGAGVATAAGAISTAIQQNATSPIYQYQAYVVEFTVTASAGTLTPSIGGNSGTTRGAGTWREVIIAGSTQVIAFTGVAFTGTLDNVTIKANADVLRVINRPNEYTLVGNQLTLNNIPPSGTANVIVFAPSQLLGAANNAAAAAATSETNAAASAAAALISQNAAAASYDSFDDRYLGPKAADPTLDNDGNALLTGALYFNTVSNLMKIYTGAIWTNAFVDPTGLAPIASPNFTGTPTGPAATRNSSSAQLANMTTVQNSQLGGFVNKFRNPGFDINVRVNGTITAGAAAAYTLDGWMVDCAGANVTWARDPSNSAQPGLGRYSALTLNGQAGVTSTKIRQRLETIFSRQLDNGQCTVQWTVFQDSGGTVTPTLTVNKANSADNFGAVTSVLAATNMQAVPNATTTLISYTFPLASGDALNGLEIIVDFGATLNGAGRHIYMSLADARNTPGVATGINNSPPLPEIRPLSIERAINERYLETSFIEGTAPAQNAGAVNAVTVLQNTGASTNTVCPWIPFRTLKRAAPTITLYNPSAANAQIRYASGSVDWSATAVNNGPYTNGFGLGGTTAAASGVTGLSIVHYLASAEL